MSWGLLLNSFGLATLVSFFAMAIGWFVAVFLAAASGRWRVVVLCGSLAAFSLPPFLVVNTWLSLLGNVGLLKPVLPLDIYSFGGAVWVLTLMLWPVPCLLSFGALKRLTPELLDAEPGLAGWPLVKGVLLPLSRSALMQSGVIVFALAFNNIAVPAILQVNIFPAKFWVEFSSTYNFKLAWQYGWVLALLPLAVLLIFRGREIAWPWESQGVRPEILADRLGGAFHRTAVSLACCAVVVSLLLPLGHLLLDGRTWSDFPDAIRAGSRSIWNSFWFASVAALLVAGAIKATCSHRGWTIHALAVRSNHVHSVVSADATPERVMHDLKAWSTRALRQSNHDFDNRPIWTRHGSTRYLFDEPALHGAIEYVVSHETHPRAHARGSF